MLSLILFQTQESIFTKEAGQEFPDDKTTEDHVSFYWHIINNNSPADWFVMCLQEGRKWHFPCFR